MADEGWFSERTICNGCGHFWVAVYPLGADPRNLECPQCHVQNSERVLLTASQEIEMALAGVAVASVSQEDDLTLEEQIDAETMEPAPIRVIPLRIAFVNGKSLYLEVVGWSVDNPK